MYYVLLVVFLFVKVNHFAQLKKGACHNELKAFKRGIIFLLLSTFHTLFWKLREHAAPQATPWSVTLHLLFFFFFIYHSIPLLTSVYGCKWDRSTAMDSSKTLQDAYAKLQIWNTMTQCCDKSCYMLRCRRIIRS